MDKASIHELIDTHFNIEELRGLCFDMNIEYENLVGDTRRTKVQSLLTHCLKHGRLPALESRCRRLHAHVEWPNMTAWADEMAKIQGLQEGLVSVLSEDQLTDMLAPLRQKEEAVLTVLFG